MPETIPVLTAAQSKELDARTIAALSDSYTLMHRAADAAAEWLHTRDERSAAVYVGPGNNGGDGWLIAGLLRTRGWTITVQVAGEPRTADAQRARAEAERDGPFGTPTGSEVLVIDALLGTGASGALRGDIAAAVEAIRASGTPVIAIDLPSGLDASTGEDAGAVAAQATLSFGSVKRGQLLRRELAGQVVVLDIGLAAPEPGTPRMVTGADVAAWLPAVRPDAYKGTRGRVAIAGGEAGMAGAVILAARGAHASSAGMVRADVGMVSQLALQVAVPFATVRTWPDIDPLGGLTPRDLDWPDAMVIGPGLDGTRAGIREAVLRLLHAYHGPVVLDAGALTAFAWRDAAAAVDDGNDAPDADHDALQALRFALRGRPALLTPHIGEFTRLFAPGAAPSDRFSTPLALARTLDATVLLKGVPTVIASPDGDVLVSAAGNPALAMGGSGDVLAGIAGALLAQRITPLHAGATAAFVHGLAAERAAFFNDGWRGITMDMLLAELSRCWPGVGDQATPWPPQPNVLLRLLPVPTR